jgi:hypothetical protein
MHQHLPLFPALGMAGHLPDVILSLLLPPAAYPRVFPLLLPPAAAKLQAVC